MVINSINNSPNIGNIDSNNNTNEGNKTSTFAGMTISLASSKDKKMTMNSTSNIQQNSLEKTQETEKADDIQETRIKTGVFGKIKITAGNNESSVLKNNFEIHSNIPNNSLKDRE